MLKERSNAWGLACAAVALALLALYSARTYGLNTQGKPPKPGGADTSPRRSPSSSQDQETAAYAGISKIPDPGERLEVLKLYHGHIPQLDPMTNPSTLSRSKFYSVKAVPSTFIDGTPDGGGGGSREDSKAVYYRFNPGIEERLEVARGARIALEAFRKGLEVHAKAAVDQVRSESRNLRLQIALVEDELRYTGENGIRLHPMVIRSLAGPSGIDPDETHLGFAVGAAKVASVEYTFDLAKITAELKANLVDYELNGRHGRINFRRKMHEIDPDRLLVVAFVQDESTSEVLQARSTSLFPRY